MKTDPESHLRMTQRRREGHEKKQAEATIEKGLLIVNTGTGKGKTTAAFGMAVRVLGHGMRLGVVQFIKGALHTSERDFWARSPIAISSRWATATRGIRKTATPTSPPPAKAGTKRAG